jgi:hypothetical protein
VRYSSSIVDPELAKIPSYFAYEGILASSLVGIINLKCLMVEEYRFDMIGSTLASPEGIQRMDTQVLKSFLQAVNLSDINIDIEALLGKKS